MVDTALESRLSALEARLATLEQASTPPVPVVRAVPSAPPRPKAPAAPQGTQRPVPSVSFEDVAGGRVLAWVGGLALVVGIVLLLSIAVSRGWIGEEARTVLAGLASLALLGGGVLLYGARGRADAALAAAAAGVAGLFATCVVATQVYELVPGFAGLAAALATGAVATWLAVRWDARGLAALGILGGLLAPVLVGAEAVGAVLAAYAAACAICVARGWSWLALPAWLAATSQWLAWAEAAPLGGALAVGALGFVLTGAAAVGFDLRRADDRLRVSSHALLALNAAVTAAAGWFLLDEGTGGTAWLFGVAVAHLGLGLAGQRLARGGTGTATRSVALAAFGLGVILADVALSTALSGVALPLAWTAGAAGFAALARVGRRSGLDQAFAGLGLGGHIAIALGHTLAYDAPVSALERGAEPAGLVALVLVAAGCALSARLVEAQQHRFAVALDVTGLAALAYVTALAVDGPALAVAWAGEAVALAALARRAAEPGAAAASTAGAGALAFAGGTLTVALLGPATPEALATGLADPLGATTALGAAIAALIACAWASRDTRVAVAAAAATLLLASELLVTPFSTAQDGQLALSAFWALTGVAVLIAGLIKDRRTGRLAGLALLGLTIGKVFLLDLATLDSLARVGSFLALGSLLLAGAYAWERIRPRPAPDLRATPRALR